MTFHKFLLKFTKFPQKSPKFVKSHIITSDPSHDKAWIMTTYIFLGSDVWLVSENGNDSLICGPPEIEPCFTLSWTLKRSHNTTTSPGELIRIATDKTLLIDKLLIVSTFSCDRNCMRYRGRCQYPLSKEYVWL